MPLTQVLKEKKIFNSNKVSVFCESYEIEEQTAPRIGSTLGEATNKVTLKGTALIFNRPTRNKVMYTLESAKRTLPTWVGRPFLNSHDDSNVLNSIGHIESMDIGKDAQGRDAMFYAVDIDPAEKDFIRKAKRKDIPHVSIQVLVSDVRRKESVGFGDYIEADIKEGLELSAVLIPGDWESNGIITEQHFAENFLGGVMKEDLNDIIEAQKDKDEKEPMKTPKFKGGVPPAPYEEKMGEGYCPKCGSTRLEFDDEAKEASCNSCGWHGRESDVSDEDWNSKEDLTTGNGAPLIANPVLPIKRKTFNKITPDTVPPTMISKASEKIDDVMKKKTNEPDATPEEQQSEYTYGGKTIKYDKKGGNNIPAPYPKGFKAEKLSIWRHCNRPMFVGRNSLGKTAMFCKGCGKTITVNEGIWKETYKNNESKYEFLKMTKILTRRK